MYSLMIGNENAGDFHDWPDTWQRSSDALSRYQILILRPAEISQILRPDPRADPTPYMTPINNCARLLIWRCRRGGAMRQTPPLFPFKIIQQFTVLKMRIWHSGFPT